MKKGRILRLMFILAVTTIMIAATAVVASAATVNKNDADYKYSKTYDNGVKISFTTDVFGKKVVDDSVFCRIDCQMVQTIKNLVSLTKSLKVVKLS